MFPWREVLLLLGAATLLVTLGVLEWRSHLRGLARLPIRVHINGTRGKSSVTRLLVAGLRSGGIKVLGKVTGTEARLLLPDGSEERIDRPGRANIIEQRAVVGRANELGCEALVVECMALNPGLQWLSEARLVQATVGVITNVRADHLDVMGPTEIDVARAMAGFIPAGRPLLTAERDHLAILAAATADRGATLMPLSAEEVARVSTDDLARFPYIEHADNIALALALCDHLGVERETALEGMTALEPGPGAAVSFELKPDGRRFVFVNAFAANDPESTRQVYDLALARHADLSSTIALFNCRWDRADRSRQLARALRGWPAATRVAVMGTGTRLFSRIVTTVGGPAPAELPGEGADTIEILEALFGLAAP